MTSENTTNYMTEDELTVMENKLRKDVESGKLETKDIWELIQGHAIDIAGRCSYRPSRAVALISVMLYKLPVTLDILIESNPEVREKLENTQTAFRMLEDSVDARYKVKNILEDKEHFEFAKQTFLEMNAFMAVTTCFQDMCYISAVINYVSQQMVEDWAEFLEEGFNADKAKGLQVWKEIASAASLANNTIW